MHACHIDSTRMRTVLLDSDLRMPPHQQPSQVAVMIRFFNGLDWGPVCTHGGGKFNAYDCGVVSESLFLGIGRSGRRGACPIDDLDSNC